MDIAVSVEAALSRLGREVNCFVRRDEPLARHTTYRIGGPADLFIIADTVSDLRITTDILIESGIEWMIVGKGSNILAADRGYRGAIIVLGRDFRKHFVAEDMLVTGAGTILAHVVQDAYSAGLSGLEFAVGIPGTVGGALAMNAGTADAWIGSCVTELTLFAPGKGLIGLKGHEIAWGYRYSDVLTKGLAVECRIKVDRGDTTQIRSRMDLALTRRKATQPIGLPCAGSVFRNPDGDSAGRLIEAAGLKGKRIGKASISDVHSNFIVNLGGASANDVLRLIHEARDTVRQVYGVELQPEIKFVGQFE